MIQVPLLNPKFANRMSSEVCANFRFAALTADLPCGTAARLALPRERR